MNGNDIVAAVRKLHEIYPNDRVAIWCKLAADGTVSYTAHLNENRDLGLDSEFGHGSTPDAAAQDLFGHAGSRNPETIKANHVAKLKAQLAQLEAKLS